jgi:hypothetical protein
LSSSEHARGDYQRRGWHVDYAFSSGRRFEPELVTIMTGAFALACKALRLFEENDPLRPLVARHIIGLGERGFRDRIVVYLLTLREFKFAR